MWGESVQEGIKKNFVDKLTLKLSLDVGILQLEMVEDGIFQAKRQHEPGPGGWQGSMFGNHGLVQDGIHGSVLSRAGPAPRSF